MHSIFSCSSSGQVEVLRLSCDPPPPAGAPGMNLPDPCPPSAKGGLLWADKGMRAGSNRPSLSQHPCAAKEAVRTAGGLMNPSRGRWKSGLCRPAACHQFGKNYRTIGFDLSQRRSRPTQARRSHRRGIAEELQGRGQARSHDRSARAARGGLRRRRRAHAGGRGAQPGLRPALGASTRSARTWRAARPLKKKNRLLARAHQPRRQGAHARAKIVKVVSGDTPETLERVAASTAAGGHGRRAPRELASRSPRRPRSSRTRSATSTSR